MDAAKAMMDELMGAHRNFTEEEAKTKMPHFTGVELPLCARMALRGAAALYYALPLLRVHSRAFPSPTPRCVNLRETCVCRF